MIPVLSDGRVIMVKQYRHAVREELIEFPAGTIDRGEKPIECAKRELVEEIGKSAGELLDIGILYPCPGFCSEIQYLFVARELADAEMGRDEDELIEVLLLEISEVHSLIKHHKILDGKTIAAFYRATALGFLGS
jgi:ADP-ribose pyrophosphatase